MAVDPQTDSARSSPGAKRIYQAHLDFVTNASWSGDFEAAADRLILPAELTMPDASVTLTTLEQMVALLRDHRDGLLRLGTTALHRICTEARFVSEREIAGVHTSYVLRGGFYAMQPFTCYMPLIQGRDGHWRARGIHTEARNAEMGAIRPELIALLETRSAGQAHDRPPAGDIR